MFFRILLVFSYLPPRGSCIFILIITTTWAILLAGYIFIASYSCSRSGQATLAPSLTVLVRFGQFTHLVGAREDTTGQADVNLHFGVCPYFQLKVVGLPFLLGLQLLQGLDFFLGIRLPC